MRKYLLTSFIFLIAAAGHGQDYLPDPSVEGLYKFSDNYFRSDPFKGAFSDFLKHLINDPDIDKKMMQKRTDTSFYSFEGVYKKYNPFFFTPKRIEIILQEAPVKYLDSMKTGDTIFTYQLLAYANDDIKGAEDIKKEFEKIHRQNRRKFFDSNFKEIVNGDKTTTSFYNYFLPLYWLAPLSVVHGELKEQHEFFLNIILRFKMDGNKAVLPAPLNGP
jgi:hypothetical protein